MRFTTIDFARYCSLKIGQESKVALISNETEAKYALKEGFYIIGAANNLLISPQVSHLAILDKSFDYIRDIGELLEIGAACHSLRIFQYFKRHNLSGVEFLQALPGTLGGLIKMNAGMKSYEIKSILHSINVNGDWRDIADFPMAYRSSGIRGIILAARFYKRDGFDKTIQAVCNHLRKSHPKEPSCGSCFKNPPNDYAGRILESLGLKGFCINDAAFSQKHANFLINKGGARFEDALNLINLAKTRVYETYKIKLECEVQILK